jgi:biopolymer transport protein ExbD
VAKQPLRTLDVWIVETNTVYRQVPYNVVTDWVQQGRLLADDQVRPAGTGPWQKLGEQAAFAAFLPKAEPFRADDAAEAMEPVHTEIVVKHRRGDEDEDVDMIPLIDISLVLLIFFMMTAAVGGAGSIFDPPEATHMLVTEEPNMLWVGINRDKEGNPQYSLGRGEFGEGEKCASREELVAKLEAALGRETNPVNVSIKANQHLPYAVIQDMTLQMERYKRQRKVVNVFGGVNERKKS